MYKMILYLYVNNYYKILLNVNKLTIQIYFIKQLGRISRCRQVGEFGGCRGDFCVITFTFSVNSDSVICREQDVGDLEREEGLKGVVDRKGLRIQA